MWQSVSMKRNFEEFTFNFKKVRYWEENKCKQKMIPSKSLLVLLSMTSNWLPWYLGSLREAEEKKKWIPNSQSITFLPINTYHQPYSQLGTLPTAAAFEMFMMVVLFSAFSQSSKDTVGHFRLAISLFPPSALLLKVQIFWEGHKFLQNSPP